ncbi:DNA-binding MltR family transcriptional regulator [Chitinophaga sp. W2I13]|uniref:hypothetical protein n=1 Tax=Chitinophaga sp. W2I13 TaxID=3373923 RepID=UPI003D23C34F
METNRFDSFVEDFLGERKERSIVIVGSSKIDDLLGMILKKFLIDSINPKEEDMIHGDNPLSTFSAIIKLCYRLGLIDRDLFSIPHVSY